MSDAAGMARDLPGVILGFVFLLFFFLLLLLPLASFDHGVESFQRAASRAMPVVRFFSCAPEVGFLLLPTFLTTSSSTTETLLFFSCCSFFCSAALWLDFWSDSYNYRLCGSEYEIDILSPFLVYLST
jgi:hypothetical protein